MNANEPTLPEESLFLQALELGSAEERAAFLGRSCGSDAELRRGVEALLRHHREGSSFLEAPPTEVVVAAAQLTTSEPDLAALDFLSPSDEPLSLGRLGYYEVVEVLGRGGFGVVLKARDTKLDRIVAVKTLAQSLASSATARKRFVREAKAAAAVKHENVVGIYHVADDGPVPYLVMECVSGVSLEAKLQEVGTLDLPAILRIGTQIASGLAAAHKQGLVHRDVKPGNILLENGVERVKITDFGLARAADDAAITRTGEVAGTPQYMSPEQAQGLPLDGRSDLFSLGSVLYAMGTGRSPFRAESTVAALRRVCDDTPRPIREINGDIPDWLADIINRLLAKQPNERFQTATEVADLLGHHLAEVQRSAIVPSPKPTIVSPRHRPAIGSRWWSVALIALVSVACIMGLTEASGVTKVVPTVIRIVRGEGTLVIETDRDVHVTLEGNGDLTFNLTGGQSIRVPTGDYRVKATREGEPVPLDMSLVEVSRGGRSIVKVKLEPADTRLTPAEGFTPLFNGRDLSGWETMGAGNWRVEDGAITCSGPRAHLMSVRDDLGDFQLRVEVKINAGGNSGVYFRAGKPLTVIGDYEAQITDNPDQVHKTGSLFDLVRVTESPVPPNTWFNLEVIAKGQRIRILVNGKQTAEYTENRAGRNSQGRIALQHYDPQTRVFFRKVEIQEFAPANDIAKRARAAEEPVGELTLLKKLQGHTNIVHAVSFLPDGQRMVSVDQNTVVRTWDLETRSVLSTFDLKGGYCSAADVSANGRFVATTTNASDATSRTICVWDLQNRKQICEAVQQNVDYLTFIRFSPDGTRVVTSGKPSTGVLWDIATGKEVQRFEVHEPQTLAVEFSPDGRLLAMGAAGRVRLFDVESGDVLGDAHLPESRTVISLAFSPGGDSLACGQMSGYTSVIDVNGRQLTASLTNDKSSTHVISMRFIDNERLLITRFGGAFEVWDLPRTKIVATGASELGTTKRLALSPNGRYALAAHGERWDEQSKSRKATGDYALRLWQLPQSVWPKGSPSSSAETAEQAATPKDP